MRLSVIESAIKKVENARPNGHHEYVCLALNDSAEDEDKRGYNFINRSPDRLKFEKVFSPFEIEPFVSKSFWRTDSEGKHIRLIAMELFKQLIISGDLIHWEEV